MSHDSFHIAVLAGDGIGPEVMAPALEVLVGSRRKPPD
jgi:3-isopropylmalate dehydrogenase